MSTQRVYIEARGWTDGKRVDACRCGCGRKPEPPRRTFYSGECVHDHRMKTNPGYVRWKVFERDRGVCVICRRDMTEGLPELHRARMLALVMPLGQKPSNHSLGDWQADHILPVVEGGGLCGLENYRTLCTRCHKDQTARLSEETRQGPKTRT